MPGSTAALVAKLDALAAKTIPPPWKAGHDMDERVTALSAPELSCWLPQSIDDSRFCAEVRNAWPQLSAALRALPAAEYERKTTDEQRTELRTLVPNNGLWAALMDDVAAAERALAAATARGDVLAQSVTDTRAERDAALARVKEMDELLHAAAEDLLDTVKQRDEARAALTRGQGERE